MARCSQPRYTASRIQLAARARDPHVACLASTALAAWHGALHPAAAFHVARAVFSEGARPPGALRHGALHPLPPRRTALRVQFVARVPAVAHRVAHAVCSWGARPPDCLRGEHRLRGTARWTQLQRATSRVHFPQVACLASVACVAWCVLPSRAENQRPQKAKQPALHQLDRAALTFFDRGACCSKIFDRGPC